MTLTWTDPQDTSITGYRVLLGTEAGSLSAIADDTGSVGTEYTDTTVAAETSYFYAVLALSQDGDGAQSATISAITPAATDDATLGSLSVAGEELAEPFDAAVLDYTADAAAEATRVTVAAEAADSNACGVEISPADADPAAAGHQVDLADDGAVVAVTVTAADCATTGTYTLTVSRSGIRPAAARRLTRPLILQRRFVDVVSFWSEIAPQKARPQSCQSRGQVSIKRCSRSFSCEQSL